MSATAPSTATKPGLALFESIAQAYFTALRDGNLAPVPWAPDVVLRAPLSARNPLTGRAQVEEYLQPMAGNLGEVRVTEIFISTSQDAMAVEAIVGPLHVLDKFVIRDGLIVEQQNFFDPRPALNAPTPGGLTLDERTLLIERLEASRGHLHELLIGLSPEALDRKPAGGGWSALECAEHLVLSEETLLHLVRDQILTSPSDASLPLELQGRDGAIVAAMNDRSNKANTFDALLPRGTYSSAAAVLDAFLARRAATLDFARATTAPLHHHASPLQGLGLLDAYHWLLLMAAHTDRHVEQIRAAVR